MRRIQIICTRRITSLTYNMKIKVNCFIEEIEIEDFLEVRIEKPESSMRKIKKLTIKLDDQLSFVLTDFPGVKDEFNKVKQLLREEQLKKSDVIDLSIFT